MKQSKKNGGRPHEIGMVDLEMEAETRAQEITKMALSKRPISRATVSLRFEREEEGQASLEFQIDFPQSDFRLLEDKDLEWRY